LTTFQQTGESVGVLDVKLIPNCEFSPDEGIAQFEIAKECALIQDRPQKYFNSSFDMLSAASKFHWTVLERSRQPVLSFNDF